MKGKLENGLSMTPPKNGGVNSSRAMFPKQWVETHLGSETHFYGVASKEIAIISLDKKSQKIQLRKI